MAKYICTQNCPECEGHHCRKFDLPTHDPYYYFECPVGNIPIWRVVK